jgi:plastocyanin
MFMRWLLIFFLVVLVSLVQAEPFLFLNESNTPQIVVVPLMNDQKSVLKTNAIPQRVDFRIPPLFFSKNTTDFPPVFFTSYFDSIIKSQKQPNFLLESTLQFENDDKNVYVFILENKFDPSFVEVSVGDTIVWINKRKKLNSFIIGMRELSGMKSKFLFPNDKFEWTFNKPGKYVYVDGIIIGLEGKIVVS